MESTPETYQNNTVLSQENICNVCVENISHGTFIHIDNILKSF